MNSCDNRFGSAFYACDATCLAEKLVGQTLSSPEKRLLITETEAYLGESDTACHASRGRTARTETLYRAGGTIYVYLCYGIHSLINIVAGREGEAECVLIRACEKPFDGPGKLTRAMGIDRRLNGLDIASSPDLWIEPGLTRPAYVRLPRVGIDYAAPEDRLALLRYQLRPEAH